MKKQLSIALLLSAVLLGLFSCKSSSVDVAGQWALESVAGVGPSDSTSVFFCFTPSESRLFAFTGVNILNGNYTVCGDKIDFGTLQQTMMAGPEEDMALEARVTDAVNATKKVANSEEGKLLFLDEEGNCLLTLTPASEEVKAQIKTFCRDNATE